MPVRMVEMPAFGSPSTSALARGAVGPPVADHLLEVGDQQVGRRGEILRAALAIAAGAVGRVVVGVGALAGARPGAVQILAPEQELDGVIAGRDIGLDVAGLLQRARQQLRRDLRGVDLLAVDLDRRVGDHIGGVERVLVGLRAVASRDIVDQAFVQRPGVHAAFPVVDDGVAETVDLGLLVGNARRFPGFARGVQRLGRRLGDQRVDGLVERLGRGQRVLISGERDVGIGRDHRLRIGVGGLGRQHEERGRQQRSRRRISASRRGRAVSRPHVMSIVDLLSERCRADPARNGDSTSSMALCGIGSK